MKALVFEINSGGRPRIGQVLPRRRQKPGVENSLPHFRRVKLKLFSVEVAEAINSSRGTRHSTVKTEENEEIHKLVFVG